MEDKHAKQIAGTIIQQLKYGDIRKWWSWGVTSPRYGTDTRHNPFLQITVNGRLHKGKVRITLEGNDTYTVVLLRRDGSIKLFESMVYCDTIRDTVDRMVEYTGNDDYYKRKYGDINP